MEAVDELCNLLQLHANRDKVVCLASYALKLWGSTAQKAYLLNASARLAGARACLRLFEDAPTIRNILNYGLGKHEGPLWGALGVAGGVFTLAYYQAEKLVFLLDTGVLVVAKDIEFWVRAAHKLLWSLFAFVGFIRSIRALHLTALQLNSPERPKSAPARFTQATLVTTKLALDTLHAVSWLPAGWLWGSALTVPQASGLATTAAALGLVIHYNAKRIA